MTDTNARKRAKSLFDRETRREAEIADALKQEQARHERCHSQHASPESLALVAQRQKYDLTHRRAFFEFLAIGPDFFLDLTNQPNANCLKQLPRCSVPK